MYHAARNTTVGSEASDWIRSAVSPDRGTRTDVIFNGTFGSGQRENGSRSGGASKQLSRLRLLVARAPAASSDVAGSARLIIELLLHGHSCGRPDFQVARGD